MSAFIVNKEHIDALVRLAVVHDVSWYDGGAMRYTRHDPDGVGLMLLTENVNSVRYRYEDTPLDHLPGPLTAYWTKPYSYSPMGKVPTAVQGLKLVACLDYQSCEHPGWEASNAHKFCESLKDALINVLPGYEEAPWEWGGR